MSSAVAATESPFELAEGPVWDERHQVLRWVDMTAGLVVAGVLDGDRIKEVNRERHPSKVAAVLPCDSGDVVVILEHLAMVTSVGGLRDTIDLHVDPATQSVNDASCDPAGRLVYGTKGTGPQVLLRRELDGSVTVIDDDLTLSNGIAWAPDGRVMYHADTFAGIVWKRSYDVESGRFGERRVHVDVKGEWPDGLCVDHAGRTWVALWGSGRVSCFDPDGRLAEVITVAAPQASSVCFAGADRQVLVITTAREGLSAQDLIDWPESGRVFLAHPTIAGLSETPFTTSMKE